MKPDPSTTDQALFEAETARFRAVLAKGRSANQLALFDFLVERAGDERPPKEIEIALALFGEDATQDSSGDSGARVYVHRLRKRMGEYYSGKSGPKLAIPTGEYRIVLQGSGLSDKARSRVRRFGTALTANPALSAGLGLILFAVLILVSWAISPAPEGRTMAPDRQSPLPGALADISSALIVVGDSMLVAESDDQRSVQRMILDPQIRSRGDLSQYLRANPEAFYRIYDFNLNFAPIASVEAAWQVQDELATMNGSSWTDGRILPASALTSETLRSHDLLFVGRLSQLGPLGARVFAKSRFELTAFDRLTDRETRRSYAGQVYSEESGGPVLDYAYLAVTTGPEGNGLVVLAGLGDLGTLTMADLLSEPRELAPLAAKLGRSKRFEALFEVRAREGLTVERRLVSFHPLP